MTHFILQHCPVKHVGLALEKGYGDKGPELPDSKEVRLGPVLAVGCSICQFMHRSCIHEHWLQ